VIGKELLQAIEGTGCEKVICTHGYTEIFSRFLREKGYDARTEETQYEGEIGELEAKSEVEKDPELVEKTPENL